LEKLLKKFPEIRGKEIKGEANAVEKKRDLVFCYGDRVRVREGFFKEKEGKCVDFFLGDITVDLDDIGFKHFVPTNLEKIND